MTNTQRKAKEIRADYIQLSRQGVKKGERIKKLAEKYYLTERQIWNHLKVKQLRALKTA